MVRVLAVSDEVDEVLQADPALVGDIDLIVSCGDLPFDYLSRLADALDAPLVLVPGNHDPDLRGYRLARSGLSIRDGLPAVYPGPPGAVNADGKVVDVGGVRVAGLGGSLRYRPGPNQYTQRQQARRARALARRAGWRRIRDGRRVDLLLTHAPPPGLGDRDDLAHAGFACLGPLARRLGTGLLLHGHVHPFGQPRPELSLGATRVRNVVGRHVIEVDPSSRPRRDSGGR